VVRHSSDFSELAATGLPLGLFSHTTLEAGIIALEPGDAMIVVSKGVVDAESHGEEFGLRRVSVALRSSGVVSAQDLCTSIVQAAEQHSRQGKTHELTALSLIRRIT
jgi:serine phosphatase RsbU (regulator of sigma subunit)